jgi:SAM-dependent methyltransferase
MDTGQRDGFEGTGPGPIAPDGCPVDLWARLSLRDEVDVIARAVPPGSSILELGSGPGRMTHPLLQRGFTLTAVDESAEMLARLHGARAIHASIENLELDETFDVVLLASFLVHTGDPALRQRLLRCCRRHIGYDGCVLIQRQGEDWDSVLPERALDGGGMMRVLSSEPVAAGLRSVHVEYVYPDARWTHTFLSRPLSTAAFESALAEASLAVSEYLTSDRTWVRAVAAPLLSA